MEVKETEKKKRGRKSSKTKKEYYFDEREELAVIDYKNYYKIIYDLNKEKLKLIFGYTDDELDDLLTRCDIFELLSLAKDVPIENQNTAYQISELDCSIDVARKGAEKIYDDILRPAFAKMIESIMRRYKLFVPNEDPEDTFNDTMSFLITRIDKYDEEKGTKAYSYYGNVCKNYIRGKQLNYEKCLKRNPSYDSEDSNIDILNSTDYFQKTDRGSKIAKEIVQKLIKKFRMMADDPYTYDLKENEVKLGKALANVLENWDYVISTDGSNKLNKNAILFFLREHTGLDTKGIRDNMKKFKNEFLIIKKYVID